MRAGFGRRKKRPRRRASVYEREGRRLAKAGMVRRLDPGYFLVASHEHNRWFEVAHEEGGLMCNCRAHAVRRVKCAHICAVEAYIGMERRTERALKIAEGGQLRRIDRHTYVVGSQTREGHWYKVRDLGYGLACECPDHVRRNSDCKHMQALRISLGTGRAVLQVTAADSCPRCGSRRAAKKDAPGGKENRARRYRCDTCDWPRRDSGGAP